MARAAPSLPSRKTCPRSLVSKEKNRKAEINRRAFGAVLPVVRPLPPSPLRDDPARRFQSAPRDRNDGRAVPHRRAPPDRRKRSPGGRVRCGAGNTATGSPADPTGRARTPGREPQQRGRTGPSRGRAFYLKVTGCSAPAPARGVQGEARPVRRYDATTLSTSTTHPRVPTPRPRSFPRRGPLAPEKRGRTHPPALFHRLKNVLRPRSRVPGPAGAPPCFPRLPRLPAPGAWPRRRGRLDSYHGVRGAGPPPARRQDGAPRVPVRVAPSGSPVQVTCC